MLYRLRDIFLAAFSLILAGWTFLFIIPILFFTQQRVFFIQERTGRNGKPFLLIKFSTLRDIVAGEREEDDQKKRLTWLGKFLRRFSLDELPQLWNILKGDMSFVGPRPLIHEYFPLYSPEQKKRFRVRPGLTGWAQIHGRNQLSFTERFKLDVWYVENRTLWLDAKILRRTLALAWFGKGVYGTEATTSAKFDGTN